MKVREIMSINAIKIMKGSTLAEAAELAAISNASGLVVVDSENNFIGVLSECDLMDVVMPKMNEIISSGGELKTSFDLFEEKGKELAKEPIDGYLIENPISVEPDDELLGVAATMTMQKTRRLPVVADGKLVGTISRGDICKAVLRK